MSANDEHPAYGNLPNFDSLWNYDRPDETEAKFREILSQAEAADGKRGYEAELLTQIARAEGLQRKFEGGHRTLDKVQGMLDHLGPRVEVRALLERGRLFNSAGEPKKAIPLFSESFNKAQAAGEESLAVDAAHMLGICESPEQALEWNLRALETVEASENPKVRRWLGSLLNNLGWTYHDRKEYPRALEFFNRALAVREQNGQAKETRIARWAVARTFRSLGRIDDALAIQRDLLRQWQTAGEEDGFVYEELGECLLIQGSKEAGKWFGEAYRALSKDEWLAANEPKRLERLKELASR